MFRALKTKHDTPKYGLIYHASLVGQAAPKHKGKISRVLAAKASLSVRQDALGTDLFSFSVFFFLLFRVLFLIEVLTNTHTYTHTGDSDGVTIALEHKAKVENRLRVLEGGAARAISGTAKSEASQVAHTPVAAVTYNDAADVTTEKKKKKKKDKEASPVKAEPTPEKKKKKKKEKEAAVAAETPKSEKKKKRKRDEEAVAVPVEAPKSEKKKKKKKAKTEQ